MRIATMTKQLLDEVRTHPLDTASFHRLHTIDTQILGELLTDLSPDLRQELQRLALPLTRHTELSDAELRLAHAQLVGWLQGLTQTAHTALSDPHAVLANDSITVGAGFSFTKANRRVICYYFYLWDDDFGPAFVKVCAYSRIR
jgi:hypothetical protein